MHFAAISGSVAVVKWLQSLGLDARAASDDGLLPLHSACGTNSVDMVSHLLSLPGADDDVGAKAKDRQLTAAGGEGTDVLQLLLSRGAVVDATDLNGATPLLHAKTVAAVKLLLAAGADPTLVNIAGSNLLHYQASFGASAGAVCMALKLGTDPTALDANACPPAPMLASEDTLHLRYCCHEQLMITARRELLLLQLQRVVVAHQ
jgi:ankyrin repeat protein